MILHIGEDNRFVELARLQFECANIDENIYLINSSNEKLKYVTKQNNVIIADKNSNEHKNIVFDSKFDLIVFHNCNQKYKWKIINSINKSTKILWLAWGSDIYQLPKLRKTLILSETKKALKPFSKKSILDFLDHISRIILRKYNSQIKAYKKIDYCAPVMSADLLELNKKYNLGIKELSFTYGSLDYYAGSAPNSIFYGNNILIGNSGHQSSNHIDAFKAIKNISKGKIIAPLSYGGSKDYIKQVNKYGKYYFKERYNPLQILIPIDEYIKTLLTCKAAFMYHKRQQAVGNIITLLWIGVKVFVDEENPVYSFYKKNNILIFSINKFIEQSNTTDITPLNKIEILNNRKQLISLYSFDNIVEETKKLIITAQGKI